VARVALRLLPDEPGRGHDPLLVFPPDDPADLLELLRLDYVANRDCHTAGDPQQHALPRGVEQPRAAASRSLA